MGFNIRVRVGFLDEVYEGFRRLGQGRVSRLGSGLGFGTGVEVRFRCQGQVGSGFGMRVEVGFRDRS